MAADSDPRQLLERVFREEAGRLTATLVRLLGDFDLAEEIVSEAMVEALVRWPRDGVPERATSWLLTTAKRKGLDRLRRDARYREKLALLARDPPLAAEPDDRLRLIFTCCHPVLSREAQIALTLRAVVGLTTAEIARAFLVPEETVAKRIVRAKRKIVVAGVPYRVPSGDELGARLSEVLTVIYLVFNEGFLTTSGESAVRRDLFADAEWLAAVLSRLMPAESEVLALLALIRLHLARWSARTDGAGRLVLLQHQDRSRWDRGAIERAVHLITRAAALRRPGPFLVEASIAALHCEASSWEKTDWPQVVELYGVLMRLDPSPVVALNRAIARSWSEGPSVALADVDELAPQLGGYHLFHAARAALLRRLGRNEEAEADDDQAIQLTRNVAERSLISERLDHAGGARLLV